MVLINGMVGIGTGFSTNIPQFNPKECCDNIKRKINGEPYLSMMPYYKGFKGRISKETTKGITKFITRGKYTIKDEYVTITELPIGKWTNDFKEYIENILQLDDPWILDYENHSTDKTVKFVLKLSDETLFDNQYKTNNIIEEKLKLTSNKNISNLHLYSKDGNIKKYETIYQILDDHYYVRLNMYQARKDYQLDKLDNEIRHYEAKMRFIEYVIEEKVKVYKQSKLKIIESLRKYEFPFYEEGLIKEYDKHADIKLQYNYLLNLSIYNFTLEKVEELENNIEDKKQKYDILEKTDIKDIWINELDIFEEEYNNWLKFK